MIRKRRDGIDKFDVLVPLVGALLLGVALLLLADQFAARKVLVGQGHIVSKVYAPAQHSTGVGLSTGKEASPVVLYTTSEESFTVLLDMGGELFSAKTAAKVWDGLKEGDIVDVYRREGVIFSGELEVP